MYTRAFKPKPLSFNNSFFLSDDSVWLAWKQIPSDGGYLIDESEKDKIASDLMELSNVMQAVREWNRCFDASEDLDLPFTQVWFSACLRDLSDLPVSGVLSIPGMAI